MKKKIALILIVTALAVLILLPLSVFAEGEESANEITSEIATDTVTEITEELTTEPETEPVTEPYVLNLKKSSINIGLGEELTAYCLITNTDKYEKEFFFNSSDETVLTIDSDGNFKGVKIGKADIVISERIETEAIDEETGEKTVTLEENILGAVTVNVKKQPDSIKFNATNLALGVGEKFDLDVSTKNGSAYGRTFTSSNKSVATVSSGGIVTPKKTGTVKITAKIYDGKTVTCTVKVTKKPTAIKITNTNSKLQKGSNNHKITYKLTNSEIKITPAYSIGSKKIATINKSGVMTAVKKGKTTVTIKTQYDNIYVRQDITVVDNALPLNYNSAQIALDCDNVTRTEYGKSAQGRKLEAYIITNKKTGKYTKTLFMDFAVHGFEDDYSRDGKVLVSEANKLIDYYSKHSEELKNYRLVIVPCANPDGTIAGKNNKRACSSAFGRCTAKHIDMNRDFKSFKAVESKSLRNFILKCKPNVYLNVHGWYDEAVGTKKLNTIIRKAQGFSYQNDNSYGTSKGYIIGYVHKKLGIPASIVEHKGPTKVSLSRDVNMIAAIIKAYK